MFVHLHGQRFRRRDKRFVYRLKSTQRPQRFNNPVDRRTVMHRLYTRHYNVMHNHREGGNLARGNGLRAGSPKCITPGVYPLALTGG